MFRLVEGALTGRLELGRTLLFEGCLFDGAGNGRGGLKGRGGITGVGSLFVLSEGNPNLTLSVFGERFSVSCAVGEGFG